MRKNYLLAGLMTVCFTGAVSSCGNDTSLVVVRLNQGFLGDSASSDLSVSIGISQNDSELEALINEALATLSEQERAEMMTSAGQRCVTSGSGEGINVAPHDNSKHDLIVGLECAYAPFNWTETTPNEYTYPIDGQSGQYADGYDIQVAKYVADYIGYNLIIKAMPWESLVPSMQTGEINAIIAGMTDTEERRQSISFTNSYYTSELVIVVRNDSPLVNITTIDELSGYKIISQVSTVTDQIIDQIEGAVHMSPVDTFSTAALSVMSGDADAMTAEYPVALAIVAANS